jgi:hypothetical protein
LSCGFVAKPDFTGAEHRASVPNVDSTARAPTRKTKVVAERSQAGSIRALSAATFSSDVGAKQCQEADRKLCQGPLSMPALFDANAFARVALIDTVQQLIRHFAFGSRAATSSRITSPTFHSAGGETAVRRPFATTVSAILAIL